MKSLIVIFILLIGFNAICKTPETEAEFKKLSDELTQVTVYLQKAWDTKNEEAMYSFNIEEKTEPLGEKLSAFRKKNPEYKESFKLKIDALNAILDKINEQHAKDQPKTREEAITALKKSEASLTKLKESGSNSNSEFVSYEDWFTLQSTSIKSGKKYSFIACVNGQRNLTALQCHVPGSAAKRVFYNTDDIKDLETKKKWVNAINQNMCVTAYVTGHEAFIVDLKDQSECK